MRSYILHKVLHKSRGVLGHVVQWAGPVAGVDMEHKNDPLFFPPSVTRGGCCFLFSNWPIRILL